jgi:hypothetical protein
MAALEGITQDEASWQPDGNTPSIEHVVRHVAWSKAIYCQQGFGTPILVTDDRLNADGDCPGIPWEFPCGAGWGSASAGGIVEAIRLLEQSHAILTGCLEACSEEALENPIPTRHGKSAAHFFWIMIMHDLYHAGQIRTRRTMYRRAGVAGTAGCESAQGLPNNRTGGSSDTHGR